MEPIIAILVIGALGGIARAVLGYEQQSDENETFNYIKAGKSVLRAAIIGAFIVLGSTAVTGSEITTVTYIMTFFTASGADVLVKEGYQTVRQ